MTSLIELHALSLSKRPHYDAVMACDPFATSNEIEQDTTDSSHEMYDLYFSIWNMASEILESDPRHSRSPTIMNLRNLLKAIPPWEQMTQSLTFTFGENVTNSLV